MKLYINDLAIETILGVYPHEKIKRKFILNFDIDFDAGKSITTDDINDTLDYSKLEEKIINFVSDKDYNLMEKMSQDILNIILEDEKIISCNIRIEKEGCTKYSKSMIIENFIERKN